MEPSTETTANTERKTKLCRCCREPIALAATRCPKCQGFQSRWWNGGFAVMTFVPLLFFIPLFFVLMNTGHLHSEPEVPFAQVKSLLTARDVRMEAETPETPEGSTVHYFRRDVWIYGTLHNESDYRWNGIELLIEFKDAQGKTLDLANVSLSVTIPAQSTLDFRTNCELAVNPADVKTVTASVTDAKKPYR